MKNDIGSVAVGKSFDAIREDVLAGGNLDFSERNTFADVSQTQMTATATSPRPLTWSDAFIFDEMNHS